MAGITICLHGCTSQDWQGTSANIFGNGGKDDTVVAHAFDATDVDFWTLDNLWWTADSIFKDMDPSCIVEVNCPTSQRKDKKEFDSKLGFHKDHAKKFGLDLGVDWKGSGGKFNIGVDNKDDIKNDRDEKITWLRLSKTSRCVTLSRACLRNASFNPSALKVLDELAAQPGGTASDDADTMSKWYKSFVKSFGSHIVTEATHGASVQALHAIDNSCHASDMCRKLDLAIKISFAEGLFDDTGPRRRTSGAPNRRRRTSGSPNRRRRSSSFSPSRRRVSGGGDSTSPGIDFGFEYKNHKCEEKSSCLKLTKTKCAAIGGGDGGTALCSPDAPASAVTGFLDGGNPRDTSSVYDFKLMPMQDVIETIPGYQEHAKQVGKAVDFAACKMPLGGWTQDGNGAHSCQCVLKCDAGFTLNKDKCSCKCAKADGCEPQKPDFPDPFGPKNPFDGSDDPFPR
jgi:hypothetical protein